MITENELRRLPDSEMNCLRCEHLMKKAGPARFQLRPEGILGAFSESHAGIAPTWDVEVFICPNCGKIEHYF